MIGTLVVNHAPSFVKGADPQNITDESNAVSVEDWATQISRGPGDSNLQTVEFIVTPDNSSLFEVQPAIDPEGTLTFTPAANSVGTAIVSVVIKDDGGTANSGSDQSDPQEFMIRITKKRVWHNVQLPQDVTGEGVVAADDVVGVINYINAGKPSSVPTDGRGGGPYCDSTGDGTIAADDVVKIINYINARPSALTASIGNSAALNPSSISRSASHTTLSAGLLDLLAINLAGQPKRKIVTSNSGT